MTTGAKMRVYEIAREVGLPNKELIEKIRALGLEVNNHMSALDVDEVARVKRSLEKDKGGVGKQPATKRLSQTVLRRRSKGPKEEGADAEEPSVVYEEPAAPEVEEKPAATPPIRRRAAAPAIEESAPPPPAPEPVVQAKPTPAQPEARSDAAEPVAPAAAKTSAHEPTPREPAKETARPMVKAPRVIDIAVANTKPLPGQSARPAAPPAPPPMPAMPTIPTGPMIEVRRGPGGKMVSPQVGQLDDARTRFEQELQRARKQAESREKEREQVVQAKRSEAALEARKDGRPEVGSVISLPVTRIKITERGPSQRQMPGQGQVRGRFAQQQVQGRGRRDRKKPLKKGTGKQTQITTPAEHKRVVRIEDTIGIQELARSMGIKATEVLKKLWGMGMTGANINASIDFDTAQILATDFGYEVQNVAFKEEVAFDHKTDEDQELKHRAPVVTVMGHVDHGKTSLLDYIRASKVAAGEAGGITQHIGAYRVNAGEKYGDIVFIDTPGHAAFTEMRARGAQATDIVVLIVAADDGVMPQTVEALSHAKDAKVPIIVAVNKCDLPSAQPDRPRQQLADHGLIAEEWGGETIYVNVSAHTGDGVDKLLESISVTAEVLELKANPDKPAIGVVIESKLDRSRGPMATILVQEGTLRAGDTVIVGETMGKVRALLDYQGKNIPDAGPSFPAELLGLDGVPDAGERLYVADEKVAKQIVEHRRQAKRKKELATSSKMSLENLMERIQEGENKELKIVLKADVHGSAEAVREALTKLSTEKVQVNVISYGVGGITESDVNLAKAGGAVVIGFHVRPAGKAAKVADQEGVQIKIYDVIYEALDEVKAAMAGLLAPIRREQPQGALQVRQTFTIPRRGVVAGCMVTQGVINRKSLLRVIRDSVQVHQGRVSSLRRFKDEASEVKEGFECGLMIDGWNDLKEGDVIETFEIVEEAATL